VNALRIGIDLGTTYSLAAQLVEGVPRVLPNALGEALTPSAVYVDGDGSVLVGAAARAKAVTEPERTALAFKRDMGTAREYTLAGRAFSPEALSALVLAELKADVESRLGAPVDEAVVTVPAYFGELQRRATQDACALAGLRVERIINEPTAAALAYGLHQRERELRGIVLDLGGGTFDVTVLEIMEGVIEIQASSGDTRLGGEDFLDILVAHVERAIREQYRAEVEPRLGHARVREACERVKQRLSRDERATLALPGLATTQRPLDVSLELTREFVEGLYGPLLARLAAPIERALRDAGRRPNDIDEVLLVGGATRMPCVARLAAHIFGRLPQRTLPPDEAVALGAAVQVALKAGDTSVADVVATDVAPFTLGIATAQRQGTVTVNGIFSPILERGTVLPGSRVERFNTVADDQKVIELEVFQGEHAVCGQNQEIGRFRLRGIPPGPANTQAVDVRFTYDMNGVLEVDATVVSTGKTSSFTIERSQGRLSKKQLAETHARLARLKFHPRESLPNATALARADSLYAELVGPARDRLGERITAFRLALDGQNAADIERARGTLNGLVLELTRSLGGSTN
jgi:molecular chaperone HscC